MAQQMAAHERLSHETALETTIAAQPGPCTFGLWPIDGTELDFRTARPLGSMALGHARTGIGSDTEDRAWASLVAPSGFGAEMAWDTRLPSIQVHPTDTANDPLHRAGLDVEPMTCPPNAFRLAVDVIHLKLNDGHEASRRIRALDRPGQRTRDHGAHAGDGTKLTSSVHEVVASHASEPFG